MRDFDVEHTAHAPDRRPPRPDRLPAPAPDAGAPTARGRAACALPEAGSYRVFADFSHDGEAHDAGRRPARRGAADAARRCPRRRRPRSDGGYEVRLDAGAARAGEEAELRFTVTRDGAPGRHRALPRRRRPSRRAARGRPRLPARPPRPSRTAARFAASSRAPGRYRLFLQFKHRRDASTRSRSPRRSDDEPRTRAPRAADRGHDLRLVREPHRARLNKLDGVDATVNYATEQATVDFDPAASRPSSSSRRSRPPATRRVLPAAEPAGRGGGARRRPRRCAGGWSISRRCCRCRCWRSR